MITLPEVLVKIKQSLEHHGYDTDLTDKYRRSSLRNFYESQGCWVASNHEIKQIASR